MNLVRDIVERPSGAPDQSLQNIIPPRTAPAPKKSLWRTRQQKSSSSSSSSSSSATPSANPDLSTSSTPYSLAPRSGVHTPRSNVHLDPNSEAARISAENDARIASMSAAEIEQEKAELEALLPPGLLQRILTRDPTAADAILGASSFDEKSGSGKDEEGGLEVVENIPSASQQQEPSSQQQEQHKSRQPTLEDADDEDNQEPQQTQPPTHTKQKKVTFDDSVTVSAPADISPSPCTHFPTPPSTELDPTDPDFLQKLHDKYFPDLPQDPNSLAWMQPVTEDEDESSPYFPSQESVSPADIRFDFRGDIIPPSRALALPTTLGLHHHSDSPGYAGYTIPELAHLCRSSVPAQRAIAVQVVGRILYKLGVNNYGEYVGDALWDIVQHTKVIESIVEAADEKKTRHLGLRTVAVEALWLWKKGGGRMRKTD
ncbi:RPAP1-like protein [Myxozyma melibiosi]|uniref:RPAP1-like protein n=1 Tax=Myxozyma melibiosi TaxID=54550 RepID=A0ABR1F3B1_9ASCO